MQKEELKFENSTVLEGMTSISAMISGKSSGVNNRQIIEVLYDSEKEEKNKKALAFIKAKSREMNFSVRATTDTELSSLTVGNSHGGIIAVCSVRTIPTLEESNIPEIGFYVMLQGIEDPYNFGYALRSLYACGCDGTVLPMRNWMGAAGVVSRSSAGASEEMRVFVSTPEECVDMFRKKGYTVVAADERTDIYVQNAVLKKPILLIVGGERRGISRALLDKCDTLVKIPYGRDFRASLSAASAATILGYEIMKQNL